MKNVGRCLLLFGVIAIFASGLNSAQANSYCTALASHAFPLSDTDVQFNRWNIREYARTGGLPAFEILGQNGFIPVLLLNKKTLWSWANVLENTFGMTQSLHPANEADHGALRLPGGVSDGAYFRAPGTIGKAQGWTPGVLMDLFSPGKAGPNAAADTGYRFKRMDSYFFRRTPTSDVYVDLAFAVEHEDQRRIWLYHAAKRIALVRIQYAFDTPNNSWIVQQRRVLQRDLPESGCLLSGGFEHCNNSRLAANGQTHVREMRQRAQALFNKSVNDVFNSPEARRFLDEAKEDLLHRDWRNRATYDPQFLSTQHYVGLMGAHLHADLSWDQKVDAISYLLAINIFEEVMQIRDRLSISEGRQHQYGNPNISAIFIYSDHPDVVTQFYDAHTRFHGAASGNGFDSSYFVTRRIHGERSPQWKEFVP